MYYVILLLLLGVGFLAWLIGELLDYSGIATIGGVLILIAGSAVVLTGIQVHSGMTKTTQYTTVNNTVVANSSTTHFMYETRSVGSVFGIGILGSLGIGGLIMLLAATMLGQTLAGGIR